MMRFVLLICFMVMFSASVGAQNSDNDTQTASTSGNSDVTVSTQEVYRSPFEVNSEFAAEVQQPQKRNLEVVSSDSLTLEGIAIGPLKKTAVISGQTYEEGEQKNGIEIMQIRHSEIDIKQNLVVKTLKMVNSSEEGANSVTPRSQQPPRPTYPAAGYLGMPGNFQGDSNEKNN